MQITGQIECGSTKSEQSYSCWFRHGDGTITSNPFSLSTHERTIAFTLQFYILLVSRISSKFPTAKSYNGTGVITFRIRFRNNHLIPINIYI
jgi:hypothetical protein